MANSISRRRFVQHAVAGGALAGLGDFGFLSKLNPVSAAESKVPPAAVQFRSDIEPLVELLETTPRENLLEVMGKKIRDGLGYRDVVAAVLLAGIRNVQPRPSVGFKFHAVLVVNSAHLASIASPETHRWLPIFWALDSFKDAQAQDVREGDWTMQAVDEVKVPAASKAREAFVDSMDSWDETAADFAAAALARSAGTADVFELLFRYGCRDFRDIGHKAIYVANSWRALGCIGAEHAEPVVRSLAYALLCRGGDPKDQDAPADLPIKRNRELAAKFPSNWKEGKLDDAATAELLTTLRTGSEQESCNLVAELLNRGIAPQSIWDGLFIGAQELLVRQPGIVALHAVTSTNALHFAFHTAANDETRRLLLLQNAAFVPLFRQAMEKRGNVKEFHLDQLDPIHVATDNPATIDDIFADVSSDRMAAAGKVLGYLNSGGEARPLIDAARLLIFLKGDNAHDYKFSSAVMEDYYHISPAWRNRYLAASVFNLRGSKQADNKLVERTRAALRA
ncbi:MAG TPA: hypothetical protein VGJ15_11600 [Pirellulales bacterium]|jgi:hypothetical protein